MLLDSTWISGPSGSSPPVLEYAEAAGMLFHICSPFVEDANAAPRKPGQTLEVEIGLASPGAAARSAKPLELECTRQAECPAIW